MFGSALVENEHRIRQAPRNIKRFLSSADERCQTSSRSTHIGKEPGCARFRTQIAPPGLAGASTC